MQKPPRITVITPSYNQAPFIERTILSIRGQQYPDLEHIVMDGGSTDGTLDILKRYQDRLTWVSEKDAGQADAINKGLRKATGEIIAYLNSDDVYEPGALWSVAKGFADHPDARWLTGRCRIIDEQDREVRSIITAYKNLLLDRYNYPLLLVTNPISQPATFWRRDVMEEFGLFDPDEHLVMDYEYWLRIGRKHRPVVLKEYLAGFRVYATSKTSSSFLTTFRREMIIARRYSSSHVLNGLHAASYFSITTAYRMLSALSRIRTRG